MQLLQYKRWLQLRVSIFIQKGRGKRLRGTRTIEDIAKICFLCMHAVTPFRTAKLEVDIAKKGKIASFQDPLAKLLVTQDDKQVNIDSGDEADRLLQLVKVIRALDPDIIVTAGGDSYLFPYFIHRAGLSANSDLGLFAD